MFDLGKAYLKEDARVILDKIAPVLKTRISPKVEGTRTICRYIPRSFLQLVSRRAVNVVKYFVEKHNFHHTYCLYLDMENIDL